MSIDDRLRRSGDRGSSWPSRAGLGAVPVQPSDAQPRAGGDTDGETRTASGRWPGVTAAVIGPRRGAHIDDALRALETPLSDGQLARLEALFPPIGRGGPTPDAWIS
jgi:hypothetical protein